MKPTMELRFVERSFQLPGSDCISQNKMILQQKWAVENQYEYPSYLDPEAPMTYMDYIWVDVPVEEE